MPARTSLLATAASVIMLAAPAANASAAACPNDPAITVTAAGAEQTAGLPVGYTFSGCHNTIGDRYTVQAVRVERDSSGQLIETPATEPQATPRNGQAGSFSGSGEFVPPVAGRYVIRVLYFAAGHTDWEMKGEAIVRVTAAPMPTPPPPPPPVPVPPPPAPVEQAEPQPEPEPEPIGAPAPQRAKIKLTKVAVRKRVKAGRTAVFRLTVRNNAKITARNVRICDRIPVRTQYVSASVRVNFTGPRACTAAKNLPAGKARTFTLRLSVDRNMTGGRIVNRAVATAANAARSRASASIIVPKSQLPRVKAPVTG